MDIAKGCPYACLVVNSILNDLRGIGNLKITFLEGARGCLQPSEKFHRRLVAHPKFAEGLPC
jgi:hypothetical protein